MISTVVCNLHITDWVIIAVYMVAVLIVGLWFTRREKDTATYFLGNRRIPWLAIGMSYLVSLLSTYSIVMIPGEIYNNGLSIWLTKPIMIFCGILSFHIFVRFYFRLGSFTPFEYLEKRYDKSVRLFVSILSLWMSLTYLGLVLFTASKVFEGGMGWEPWKSILLLGLVCIVYTVAGGVRAVIWTDVLQYVVLFGGLIVTVWCAVDYVDGGMSKILSVATENHRTGQLFAKKEFYTISPYLRLGFWLILFHDFMLYFQYNCCDQMAIQRLLSVNDYKKAAKSIWLALLSMLPVFFILWLLGLAVYTYYQLNPDPQVTSGDTALFTFIAARLPTPVPGLLFAAMFAAAMSTLDSGMNSLATIWVKEIHVKYVTPQMDERRQVFWGRIATAAVGCLAIIMGLVITAASAGLQKSVLEIIFLFSTMLVVLIPIYLYGAMSSRASSRLVWVMIFTSWGMNVGMAAWFVISNSGRTGAIPLVVPIVVCAVGVILAAAGVSLKRQRHKLAKTLRYAGLFAFAASGSLTLWFLYSNYTAGGKLSFQWIGFVGTAVVFILGAIWSIIGPRQAEDKYQGLTLWNK